MTIEQRIKQAIGELTFQNIALVQQIEDTQRQLAEVEAAKPEKPDKAKPS